MYIQGNSKLLTEIAHAKAIPQDKRMLINLKYLESVAADGYNENHHHEIIA